MGCVLSSGSRAAEPDERLAGGRTAPEGSLERTKSKQRRSITGLGRRKVFSGSAGDGEEVNAAPKKTPKTAPDRITLRAALCEGTLLGALSSQELDEMIDYMDVVAMQKGQECDLGGCLCVVLEGQVKASSGSQLMVAISGVSHKYTTGAVLGQVGLFDDSGVAGGLRAVALSASRLCKLPGTAYRRGMEFARQAHIKANMKVLSTIPIFSKLSITERLQIADLGKVRSYQVKDTIVREGEMGSTFYIVRQGGAVVTRGTNADGMPQRIDYKYPGDYFGEASLLEGMPRNATVIADVPGTEALCIDKALFDQRLLGPLSEIMDRSESTIQQQMLVSVPLLSQLTAERRDALLGRLKLETFAPGAFVFKQGDLGDRLYIIKAGEVAVSVRDDVVGGERPLNRLYTGQYFGERALLKEEPRMASTQAVDKLECYTLSKSDFVELGLAHDVAWSRRWDREDTQDVSQLQVLKSLGAGAFGTAWLVRHLKTDRLYALKALEKHMIKRQNWTSVVVREKDLLQSLSPHPCVITMHNAFQSPTHLFMLMELAPGGELFQLLEKAHRFPPEQARFFAGCVVLAIGHLHRHNIIFRDLKPENVLLSETGYLKLIDMGFAKRLGKGEKTYTLCGTPYYLAPEMILHRGHGFALDWWTVGVLTYEMMEGEPPFTGDSEMEVYGKVTRLQYTCSPSRFTENAIDFIAHLLKKEPETRLGNLRNGVNDVMAHEWFQGFSWDDLLEGRQPVSYVPPPRADKGGGSAPPKKSINLDEVSTSPTDRGYWPGW